MLATFRVLRANLWFRHLPLGTTFGPGRVTLLKIGLNTLEGGGSDDPSRWADSLNPREEYCGATIRAWRSPCG